MSILRSFGLVAIVLLMSLPSSSQASQLVDPGFLRELAQTRSFSLGHPQHVRPTPDGRAVLFLRSPSRVPELSLYELEVATGQTRQLLAPAKLLHDVAEELSPEERARRERQRVSTRGFSGFELSADGSLVLLPLSGRLYLLRRSDETVRELPGSGPPPLDPHFSPDGKRIAYVRDRDLYVLDLDSGKETRLTTSTDAHVSYGLAEFVAQEEMRRYAGYWWSPDSRELAVAEADTREVEQLHITDPAHPERPPQSWPYPRPGKTNASVRLGVISTSGGPLRIIPWDRDRFPYLASVVWKRGGPLTVVVESRDQRDLAVLAVDVPAGGSPSTRLLVSEHDDAWLNLDQSVPRWLSDASGMLWSSERSGRRRLELRDPSGKLLRELVINDGSSEAELLELLDVDTEGKAVSVRATVEPTESHIYRIALDSGAVSRLSPSAPGVYVASFGDSHRLFVRHETTLDTMPRSTVCALDPGGVREVAELPSVADKPPWLPQVEVLRVGPSELRAAVVRPRHFDPKRKYPVLVDVYGGPHHLHVMRAVSQYFMRQWLADQGFIVVASDGRGTPARGRSFERAIRGDFTLPLEDQVIALKALAARHPEMDLHRVGITGWSFGGYMAALAVLRHPEVFHIAAAGAPVVDWRDYDTHYTERYLGVPTDKETAAYDKSSLLAYATDLARPLLLIHGTADDNVYFFHTLKLADALVRAGKRFELLPLPGFTHMVADAVVRERMWLRIIHQLDEALHTSPPHVR